MYITFHQNNCQFGITSHVPLRYDVVKLETNVLVYINVRQFSWPYTRSRINMSFRCQWRKGFMINSRFTLYVWRYVYIFLIFICIFVKRNVFSLTIVISGFGWFIISLFYFWSISFLVHCRFLEVSNSWKSWSMMYSILIIISISLTIYMDFFKAFINN